MQLRLRKECYIRVWMGMRVGVRWGTCTPTHRHRRRHEKQENIPQNAELLNLTAPLCLGPTLKCTGVVLALALGKRSAKGRRKTK